MDRRNLGIIASALALVILMLWLTQGYDAGESATIAKGANPDANSANTSALASAAPGKNANAKSGTSHPQSNAMLAAQAGQSHAAANSPARNDKSGSNSKNNAAPFESPINTKARIKPAPLEPRAEPYALMANSGSATVRFSVRLIGDADPSTTVYLRQSGAEGAIALNDQGVDGDIVARDNIHGGNIVLDTSRLQPDTCLSYIAMLRDSESETVSSPLSLCISNLPVRTAASNTDNPVMFADGSKAVADEIIVTAQPGTRIAAMQALAASINATIVGSIPPLNLYQLKLAAPASEAQLTGLVGQLNTRPEVKGASINAIGQAAAAPNDPEYASQHGLQLVRAQDVWDIGATGAGVTVVVLDSGLDRTHPDFGTSGNCQLATDAEAGVANTDCGGTNNDSVGHGTQVAGVIAAKTNNALGVAGIAYGSKIHSIQVSADVVITLAEMTQGFTNAATYGVASIINASFSAGPWAAVDTTALCTSVNSAVLNGTTPIALVANAAGNNGANNYFYPARCNVNDPLKPGQHEMLTRKDLFITVMNSTSGAACGLQDQRHSTSNYGAWVDIAAPGCDIRSTTNGVQPLNGNYISVTGTSFSSPMIASAAAILKQCGVPLGDDPSTPLVIEGIEQVLKTSGANVMVTFPDGSSAPRLDIHRALAQVNHTPTAVGLTNSSLNENTNTAAGVDVGVLTTTDGDTCDKYSYNIAGGADSAAFSIDTATSTLRIAAGVLNYEAKASYAVTVTVTDYFGATFDQALTVTVNNVNEAPSIGSQSFSVNESSANGTTVGMVSASDPDAGDTKTFTITAGNTGSAFAINPTTGVITVSNTLSYNTTQTYVLTVQVSDGGGLSATAAVTINVNNPAAANNPPNISPQIFSVSESSSTGTAIGTISATDPDGDSLSYSITSGNTGNAFSLNTTTGALAVSNALSYTAIQSYTLTVQVMDTGSLSRSATMTVNVSAAAAPSPTPTPPPAAPPAATGGGGGCSVMAAGGEPDSSLLLVMLLLLAYGVRRRIRPGC